MFKKHIKKITHRNASVVPLTVGAVTQCMNFPAARAGSDLSQYPIAIIELDNCWARDGADILAFCDENNLPHPLTLTQHFVDDQTTSADLDDSDGEIQLDECVIAGAAPGFPIQTWFGENTNQSFIDLITSSTHYEQKPVSLSCSWGSSSDGGGWTAGVMASMNAAFIDASNNGIGVFCAAGDGGSTDGEPWGKHLDFPAESPYVTACGGTRLTLGTFNIRDTETVWEINGATGGGVSQNFGVPCYQQGVVPEGTKGRCIPDIAANADPETGYLVKVGLQDETPIGGTSAVAPLMAALHARLQTYFKTRIGSLNPYLYSAYKADRSIFFDVQSGSNGAYHAGPGFDMCTGLGVPDGTKLLKYLQSVIPAEQQF